MKLLFLESEIRMPAMSLPLRSTLVKTQKGVILISPINFTESHLKQIAEFGEVTDLVAPNSFHHVYMAKAIERWPSATVWGTPPLQKKRTDIKWQKMLTRELWPYSDEVEILPIEGIPKIAEVAIFCKELRTLIVADLCFNLHAPKGLGAYLILHMMGTYGKFAVSRVVGHFIKDKEAFKRSMSTLFSWDFDQVVMAHGSVLTVNGKQKLKTALEEKHYI